MNTISVFGSSSKYTSSTTLDLPSSTNSLSSNDSDFTAALQQENRSGNNTVTRENVNRDDSEMNNRKKRSRSEESDEEKDESAETQTVLEDIYVAAETVIPENIETIDYSGSTDESPYNKYLFADYNASGTEVATSPKQIADPLISASNEDSSQIVSDGFLSVKKEAVSSDTIIVDNDKETVKVAAENVVQAAKNTNKNQMPVANQAVRPEALKVESSEAAPEVVVQSVVDSTSETITVKAESAIAGNESNLRQAPEFSKTDLTSTDSAKLESDNVKILDVKYNQTSDGGKQDSMSGDTTSQENSEGLLKSLTGKMNNFMQRMQNRQQGNNAVSTGSSVFSSSRANASFFKNVATSVNSETVKNSVDTQTSDTDNTMKALSGLNIDSPRTGLTEVNGLMTGNSVSSTATQMNTSATDRVEAVQRIVETVQQFVPVQNMDRGTSMTMNVEVNNLGKMQIFLEQKENSLKVVIESDTEQGRQEMMNQKDELAQQLRMMGYKDLSVEIGGQNQQQNSSYQQEKNSANGNEDSDNVKLAGNDELDLAEILSMS